MGAVASGFEKSNNAAMFSTTDTINQGFQQMDIAALGSAHGEQKARQQDNISAQYGVGQGPAWGQQYPSMWGGYGSFNHFLYAIGFLLLGIFAIAFGLTYFVEMAKDLAMGVSATFFFFFFHHFLYMFTRLNYGGLLTNSAGVSVFMSSLILGLVFGAVWTYYILDRIKDEEIADWTVGVTMGLLVLFLLSSWSFGRLNYIFSTAGQNFSNAAQPGMYQQPMGQPGMYQQPMGQPRMTQIMATQ